MIETNDFTINALLSEYLASKNLLEEVVDLIITALEGIVLSKEEEKMVIEAVNSATIEYKINSLQG